MIYDSLNNATAIYGRLNPRFSRAFAWLASGAWKDLPAGKHDIEGKEIWVNLVRGETKSPPESVKWEAHREYADIQCVLEGEDLMTWSALSDSTPGDYDASKDFLALEPGATSEILVRAGEFALFFPQDAHRPGTSRQGPRPYVKAVLKVKVDDIL